MTPRLDWTWGGGSFFEAASIRLWCWQRCACSTNPTYDNVTVNLWRWLNNHALTTRPDGSVFDTTLLPSGDPSTASSSSLSILPPQNRATSASGTCGADGKQFCPYPWNATYFGSAPPRTPPGATNIEKAPSNRNLTVCGNRCKGPQDCSPSSSDHGCNCAYPFPEDAQQLGLDPVVPVAVCLVLAYVAKTHEVGARSVGGFRNSNGELYQCLCDETFASPKCCGSNDGIVTLG